MVTHRGHTQQTPPLAWAFVLDLPAITPAEHPREVAALKRDTLVGRDVTIRVGNRTPVDVDPRVPVLLAEARLFGIRLTLEGHPTAVSEWWREVSYHCQPRPREPHLRVVRR